MNFWKAFIPKLFDCFKEGYTKSIFKSDLIAGITVGVVAIPLAMAFAIASGATPEQGLITAVIGGFLISFFGGSRFSIGGPTGAFVVVIVDIIQRQGMTGLVTAAIIAGLILIVLALFRIGTWIKFIPYPLITGFTSGIAVIIFSSQMKDFFGLNNVPKTSGFIEQWQGFFHNIHSFSFSTLVIAVVTFILILCIRKWTPRLPWGITAIVIMTLITTLFGIQTETIESKFGLLNGTLAHFRMPVFDLSYDMIKQVFPDAITIALLAGIESLLCAVIADGMTGARHKSNCELLGQGLANIGSVLFGGIPATSAIARTAINVKTGAKTPMAGMIHSAVLLFVFLFLGGIVSKIPMASLSAVLVMIAWNMAEARNFIRLFKAPRGDVAVLLITFLLTILIDITVAVQVGLILAAFVFMKKMSDHSGLIDIQKQLKESDLEETEDTDSISKRKIPEGIEIYELSGPLFFAVVDSLRDLLSSIERNPKVFILLLRKVPTIDASGLNSLEELHQKCARSNIRLVLSGVSPSLNQTLEKFRLSALIGRANILPTIDTALKRAQELL